MTINGKPLTDTIGEIEAGKFLNEVTEALYNVVASVMDTRKAGKLKLTLDIKPTGKGTVNISASYEAKEPDHDRPSTTFFVGKDFSLQRNDPSQINLPLQVVDDKPAAEPIEVSG